MFMVPAVLAAIAKIPSGVSLATNFVTRLSASSRMSKSAMSAPLFSIPISARPTAMLKSTTAGTILLAIEWNGLLGMNSRKLNGSGCSSSVVLKNDADSQFGKLNGRRYTTAKVQSPDQHKQAADT